MKLIYIVFAIFHLKHLQRQFIYVHVLLLTLCCYSQYVVTNVAPMKDFTIPQLKLMSCNLLIKLLQSFMNRLSLDFTNIYC